MTEMTRETREASDLRDYGFTPGHWPHRFIYDGETWTFVGYEIDPEGDRIYTDYLNETRWKRLRVYND